MNWVVAGPQTRTMLAALEYGVSVTDTEVAQASLEAVAALAKSHFQVVEAGVPGLSFPEGMLRHPMIMLTTAAVFTSCFQDAHDRIQGMAASHLA